jgi:transcriptional regulator with XRE-family HTH domain
LTPQDDGAHWPALAQAVRDRRRELGIPTQRTAAELAGISQSTWQRLENATPISMTTLKAVADVLRWDPSYPPALLEQGPGAPKRVMASPPVVTLEGPQRMTLPKPRSAAIEDWGQVTVVPDVIPVLDSAEPEQAAAANLVLAPIVLPRDVFDDLDEDDVRWLIDSVTRQGRELAATISEARRRARCKEQQSCGD